jgi:hypothetical protein
MSKNKNFFQIDNELHEGECGVSFLRVEHANWYFS